MATRGPNLRPVIHGNRFRSMVAGLLVFGLVGIGAELLLLGHFEGFWQMVPLGLLALSLLVLLFHAFLKNRTSIHLVRSSMALLIAGGLAGLCLHYKGNLEFELEMEPDLSGMKLFGEAMTGATPVLAPGALIQLGLLGLVYTYRHPAIEDTNSKSQ